jgi:hypothetical protein
MHPRCNAPLVVVLGAILASACAEPAAQSEIADATTPPVVVAQCDRAGDAPRTLPLETIPAPPPRGPGVFLIHQLGAACDALGPVQVLLQNTSPSPVTIDALGTSDEDFSVKGTGLPRQLAPNETYPVFVDFRPHAAGESSAMLVVMGPDGCVELPISGRAADAAQDGVFTFSPYAMDFRHIPVGTTSKPQDLTLLEQPKTSSEASEVAGFGVSSAAFEIVSAPVESDHGKNCQHLKVSIRFVAPATPGTVRGSISWTVNGGEYEAFVSADLIGTAE